MYHTPFFGWIKDLSAPDPTSWMNLFGLLPYNPHAVLPSFLAFLSIGIWPILLGITQWVQTKMNPAPADPVQAQMFGYMPILFTFMFASLPSGLVIYYAWSNFLTLIQQYVMMTRHGVEIHLFNNLKFPWSNTGKAVTKPKAAEGAKTKSRKNRSAPKRNALANCSRLRAILFSARPTRTCCRPQ